jgi:putative DNA primase/helicase
MTRADPGEARPTFRRQFIDQGMNKNTQGSRDPISLETAERMLSYVRGVEDRDTWVKLAFVLKDEFGEVAFDAWDQWSQSAGNYDARAARDVWKSCRSSGSSRKASIGTLVALAKEGGWKPSETDRKPIDPAEVERRRVAREQRLQEEQAEDERLAAEAAAKAAKMWAAARPAENRSHDYLARKQISGIGARTLRDMLLVPLRHGPGALVGLQVIHADGAKKYLTGTPKMGAYTTLGIPGRSGTLVICEGYATGVSIHMATGFCTVVAFDSGNLEHVAKKIRTALPTASIVIAADDDAFTEGNPGMAAAIDAAEQVNALVAAPLWAGDRSNGTDFNDLHVSEGLDAVRMCFEDPKPPSDLAPIESEPEPTGNVMPESDVGPGAPNNTGSALDGVLPSPSESAQDRAPARTHDQAGAAAGEVKPTDYLPAPNGMVVDYVSWLPDANDKGKPLSTIENVSEICRRLGVTVRYNVISKEEEILIPGASFSIDNRLNASFAWLMSEVQKFRMSPGNLGDYLTYLADQNLYNPVANWITSQPWDGQDRLSELIGTVRAVGEADSPSVANMKATMIRKWMLAAVAAAFRPEGVSAAGVLVFQGEQYLGKTKWFKTLVPPSLRVLQDGVILRPDDRDSVKQCVSNWLVELGELDATFRKSDIAALKAFITKDRDILRRAFAKKESEYARRTVFFASVNPREFLHDPTGNRRYWTIECESIDHSHDIDMQQCWAQVYWQLFQQGESWYMSGEEVTELNGHNKQFEVIDPIAELIESGLNWNADQDEWTWMPATQVLKLLGRDTPTQAEATRAAHIIRERNGKQSKKSNGARSLRVPPRWQQQNWPGSPY